MNTATPAAAPLPLTPEQLAQQADLARRILNLTYLGTPRVESNDPHMPALLALHAMTTAWLALAESNPGITDCASHIAFDMSHQLKLITEQRAATAH